MNAKSTTAPAPMTAAQAEKAQHKAAEGKKPEAKAPEGKKAAAAAKATDKPAAGFRPAAFAPTARLTIVSDQCPKRPGTKAHEAWTCYHDAKGKPLSTVEQVLARFKEKGHSQRYARSALRWDTQHGFIKIEA